ncbi:MAG: phosphate ABC transporter permease subunit PstC [Pseudomonadota bacterium]
MQPLTLLIIALLAGAALYAAGTMRAVSLAPRRSALASLPSYYGAYSFLWVVIPVLAVLFIWSLMSARIIDLQMQQSLPAQVVEAAAGNSSLALNEIRNIASGAIQSSDETLNQLAQRYIDLEQQSRRILSGGALALMLIGAVIAMRRISPEFGARQRVERFVRWLLLLASSIAVLTTIGIVASVLLEAMRFFGKVPVTEFLFGLEWSPQTAIREDQVGSSGSFGAVPLFAGTMLITAIAMLIATPVGLMTAIYLSEYARPGFRSFAKPVLEVLAGIPTVVYGFFAALTVAPLLRGVGESLGISVASESALAAGLVMGIMIIPLISSLSDDALTAVPRAMKDGSLALGATRSETIRQVLVPAALPGIVGGILLAISRAIGETMIVVMAAGLSANLTANPFEAVTTVTVQIVTLLVGDQEFDSAKTLAAFALGLLLFLVTLGLNIFGLQVVRKYREQYE